MKRFTKRAWFVLAVGALAVPLAAAALAYGCTALATLTSSSGSAAPGGTVTVTGKYFGTHDPADSNSAREVEIRLGSLTGPVLATASPAGAERSFAVPVTIPDVAPGDTFLSATQLRPDGTPVYGTPARQAFTVLAPASGGGSTAPATQQPATTLTQLLSPTLTMSAARRNALLHIKRTVRGARRVRASCKRRSRTSAVCLVRWRKGSKVAKRRLVVRSPSIGG